MSEVLQRPGGGTGGSAARWVQLALVVALTGAFQAYLYAYLQPQLGMPSILQSSPRSDIATGSGLGGDRLPRLLLLMLVRDEEQNLGHVLPVWAANIDSWLIGVDGNTTDRSEGVIADKLGHLPGRVLRVSFGSSFGALWTYMAAKGAELYPQATHAIIAHADYFPVRPPFAAGGAGLGGALQRPGPGVALLNRTELLLECPQQRINIWMHDWVYLRRPYVVYRNLPGVVMPYRMSEALQGPPMPGAPPGPPPPPPPQCSAPISFHVEEMKTGFLFRLPGALAVLQGMADEDLAERPDDPHAVYNVGYVLYDAFLHAAAHPTEADWHALWKGMEHLERRSLRMAGGDPEERWAATIKLAEIYERFLADMGAAEEAYAHSTRLDGRRADGWFYLGQRQRLSGRCHEAVPHLRRAAGLPLPEATASEWVFLYRCLVHLELARAITCADGRVAEDDMRLVRRSILTARQQCPARLSGEMGLLMEMAEDIGAPAAGPGQDTWPAGADAVAYALGDFLAMFRRWDPRLRDALSHRIFERQGGGSGRGFFAVDLYTPLRGHVDGMEALMEAHALGRAPVAPCRDYRLVTRPYLFFFQENEAEITRLLAPAAAPPAAAVASPAGGAPPAGEGENEEGELDGGAFIESWLMYNARIRSVCRSLTTRAK